MIVDKRKIMYLVPAYYAWNNMFHTLQHSTNFLEFWHFCLEIQELNRFVMWRYAKKISPNWNCKPPVGKKLRRLRSEMRRNLMSCNELRSELRFSNEPAKLMSVEGMGPTSWVVNEWCCLGCWIEKQTPCVAEIMLLVGGFNPFEKC